MSEFLRQQQLSANRDNNIAIGGPQYIVNVNLPNHQKHLPILLDEGRAQLDCFVRSFKPSIQQDLLAASNNVESKLRCLNQADFETFSRCFRIPRDNNYGDVEALKRLWEMLTLIHIAYPDWELISVEKANIRFRTEQTFRYLVYSVNKHPMPLVILQYALQFPTDLYEKVFHYPLLMENHRKLRTQTICKLCGQSINFGSIIKDFTHGDDLGAFSDVEKNNFRMLETVEVSCIECIIEEALLACDITDLIVRLKRVI